MDGFIRTTFFVRVVGPPRVSMTRVDPQVVANFVGETSTGEVVRCAAFGVLGERVRDQVTAGAWVVGSGRQKTRPASKGPRPHPELIVEAFEVVSGKLP